MNYKDKTNEIQPAIIDKVEAGSIGEDIGCEPGDKLLRINGSKPRDIIDYRFLIVEEVLNLEIIDKKGVIHSVEIEKESEAELGLSFTEALFDGLKQCNNNCPFCFIDQQPPGKRKSLYLKDDDYRLSFLYGSYLTLTNLTNKDWERIEQQRLSPLFVSVHATNSFLREKLLKNPKAGLIMEQIKWLSKRQLQIHAQVVVCPGLNDGKALHTTLNDLAEHGGGDWPTVLSTAVVPVGLTRFRPSRDELKAVNKKFAKEIINQVEALQKQFKRKFGSNFAWLSDEWYLLAEEKLPERKSYENFPQQENGVGSIRAFLEELDFATRKLPKRINQPRSFSWVVGKLVEKPLQKACKRLNAIEGLKLKLYGLGSPYWGQDKVVTGLLTGRDLIDGLKNCNLGEQLLLPSITLKPDKPIFLDDMHLKEVEDSLGVPICIVEGADEIVSAAISDFASNPSNS